MRIPRLMTQWKPRFLRAVPLSCLALLSAGWSRPLQPPADNMSREELTEQSRQMNALYDTTLAGNPDRVSINLDLSDDAQYRFVARRLQASGKDEKNAPELFSTLTRLRARAIARKQLGAQQPAQGVQPQGGIWCDHYLLTNPPTASNGGATMTYKPYVRVSCQGGANFVYADIVAYDVNRAETTSRLVSSNSGEEYGGGTDFIDVATTADVNVTEDHLLRLESMALAVDDVTGQDVSSYTVARTSIAMQQAGSFTMLHPREIVPNSQAEILMCQLRGGADCDYAVAGYNWLGQLTAYPSNPTGIAASSEANPGVLNPSDFWTFSRPYDPQRLYVPIRMDITAGVRNYLQCKVDNYTYAKIKMHTENGATCGNSVDFVSQLPVGSYSSTFNYLADLSYDLNGDGACNSDVILNRAASFSITIIGKAKCTKADGTFSLEAFTKTQTIDGSSLRTKKIFYRNSCMAEGTLVQREDGTTVPVEQVKVGDKVRNGVGNKLLTVTDVAHGNELKPFVHLRDSKGHELTLTEMHPVINARGEVVAAKNLKAKDQVRTDKGTATLTEVTRLPVNGKQVFNLRLGTDEELAGAGELGRTLYAGGILVGDMSMQEALERPEQKPADVLARLPKAWHRDFKNAQVK
ncbi:hypothetical protein D7W79_13475 [Corallococcus exercitus]|uniref:Hint domain-containing protein n=1 Tax=Corallococcus exercitus TaxID=2316736 RepID=UPI000EA23BDB|nr:Hint domain-containing protein [Corallococcus exercitus]RKG78176.1 hypothetical protein D7W79_13475 [Corallococcus exercitus]